MTTETAPRDIASIVLGVLLLSLLIIASFFILQPFLPALIWAGMIVIASWPLFKKVEKKVSGRRGIAVTIMTLIMLVILVLPLTIAVKAIVENIGFVKEQSQEIMVNGLPEAPAWVGKVPVIGPRLLMRWQEASNIGKDEVITRLRPFVGEAIGWIGAQIGGFGKLIFHFLLTLLLSAFLFANGEAAAESFKAFARRLARQRGEDAVILAASAVRAVAAGVIITALIQAVFTGIGLLLAGVPYVLVLASLAFLMCVIQIGAGPILIGSVAWLFYNDSTVAGWFLVVVSIVILVSDNFIRPFLIKRGANLPLILIFAGVVGGLIAFGVIGLFVGPVMLAVSYTLLSAWIHEHDGRLDNRVGER